MGSQELTQVTQGHFMSNVLVSFLIVVTKIP